MFYNPFVGNSRTQFMQPQQQNNFSGWNDRLTKIEEGIASLTDQFKNFQNPGNEPLPITGPSIRQPGDMGKYVADNDPVTPGNLPALGGGPYRIPFPGMNSTEVGTVDPSSINTSGVLNPIGGLGGFLGDGSMEQVPVDPIMQGFQNSEFLKNANQFQQDAVDFKYGGKDMMMNSSMAGAFKQYLNSIGKGNLYESNYGLVQDQTPLQEGIQGLANYQSQQNTGPGI